LKFQQKGGDFMTEDRLDVLVERAKALHETGGKNAFSELARLVSRETGWRLSQAAEWLSVKRPEFYQRYH